MAAQKVVLENMVGSCLPCDFGPGMMYFPTK